MHITLEADYAIRIVVHLARKAKREDANSISAATGVSLRFSLKILRNLVANGIVKSFKGTQGGYELNKDPGSITLKDILEAVEGEYMFSRCVDPEVGCSRPKECNCAVQLIFCNISKKVQEMLSEVTVESVM